MLLIVYGSVSDGLIIMLPSPQATNNPSSFSLLSPSVKAPPPLPPPKPPRVRAGGVSGAVTVSVKHGLNTALHEVAKCNAGAVVPRQQHQQNLHCNIYDTENAAATCTAFQVQSKHFKLRARKSLEGILSSGNSEHCGLFSPLGPLSTNSLDRAARPSVDDLHLHKHGGIWNKINNKLSHASVPKSNFMCHDCSHTHSAGRSNFLCTDCCSSDMEENMVKVDERKAPSEQVKHRKSDCLLLDDQLSLRDQLMKELPLRAALINPQTSKKLKNSCDGVSSRTKENELNTLPNAKSVNITNSLHKKSAISLPRRIPDKGLHNTLPSAIPVPPPVIPSLEKPPISPKSCTQRVDFLYSTANRTEHSTETFPTETESSVQPTMKVMTIKKSALSRGSSVRNSSFITADEPSNTLEEKPIISDLTAVTSPSIVGSPGDVFVMDTEAASVWRNHGSHDRKLLAKRNSFNDRLILSSTALNKGSSSLTEPLKSTSTRPKLELPLKIPSANAFEVDLFF